MPDPIKSEIITPPPNEPQPDRESQLENDLSKLFEVPNDPKPEAKEVSKDPVKEPIKEVAKEEELKDLSDKNKVPEPEKPKIEDSKPTTKEGWKVLRESHAKAKKEILEKDAEIQKLQKALTERGQTSSKELENLKKEAEDLKGYRAMIDIQADPEFIAKFDDPILEKQKEVHDILSAFGVAEAVINNIDYTNSQAISLAAHAIRKETKDDIAAEDFMSAAREARNLILKREKHLQEYKGKYKEVLENKKKESFLKQAENEGRAQKHLEAIAQMRNEHGELRFEFLVDKVAKDPTNAAEVAQVEHANKVYAAIRDQVIAMSKAETPEERMEVSVAAGYAKLADAKYRAVLKKNESLQAEIAKLSKVTSDTPKSQRIRTETNGSNADKDLDLDSALSNFMATAR